jgi:hypothetical protein
MGLTEQRPIRSGLRATGKQSRLRKMGVRDEQNRVPTRCSCRFSPQSLDSMHMGSLLAARLVYSFAVATVIRL